MPGIPPPEPYQLPNIPSNAYTLLSNFATAIDTANTKLTGHANKVRDINTSTNNAVSHVVTTSKGQATDALGILWTDSKTDLSHAHDQLVAITTPSQGIGSGPNDFQSTLDQYKATIQTGLTALDNLRQHQSSNGVVMLFGPQMMQWKQDVDQLDSALAGINMVLDGIAMAIRGLNNGFRAACVTGLVPGAPPPLFNKNAFAHQMADGGSGGGSESREELINELKKRGVKFTEGNVITIFRDKSGNIVWLEEGNSGAGLQHILYGDGTPGDIGHIQDFANIGVVGRDNIANFLQNILENESPVGMFKGGRVYDVVVNGVPRKILLIVGKNGFIVNAFPWTPPPSWTP